VDENHIVKALESTFGVDSKQSRETFGGVHGVENPCTSMGRPMSSVCCALSRNCVVLPKKTFVDDYI
jgi:hypothetical protein